MSVLVSEQETEIGELLPHIARHFVEERIFAMDDFVVREGKHEIFGESINERKGDFVVLVFPVNGIGGEILEGVVHPAHIPFKAEAEATQISWTGDTGPGGGFFGDGENSRETAVSDFIHALEKIDGVEIFAAAITIGNPFAFFA